MLTNLDDSDSFLHFDGDDSTIYGWTMTPDGWYSGADDLIDTSLYGEAYVNPVDPTLTINTYWDIEDFWDFGFVQVSTDGGATWTSLENEYTTFDHDPSAHPDIVANLPGLTGYSSWVTMDFDLTSYAGETVLINFRYMTDWVTVFEGWYISEASVSGTPIELTAYYYPEADFQVTVIGVEEDDGEVRYKVKDMNLKDLTEKGKKNLDAFVEDEGYALLIISPVRAPGFSDYMFKVIVPD